MKKAITLIEIIIAIVLIAIILGLTIPKIMSNAKRAEIKQTIVSDVKAIIGASQDRVKSSYSKAYNNVNSDDKCINGVAIESFLSSDFKVGFAGELNEFIYSTGFETGSADPAFVNGIRYIVAQRISAPNANNGIQTFAIAMDLSGAANSIEGLGWDQKEIQYAREVFDSTINEASQRQSILLESGTFTSGSGAEADDSRQNRATPTSVATLDCGLDTSRCYEGINVK
jgi:type II secretory pathway pseudopilin PulG